MLVSSTSHQDPVGQYPVTWSPFRPHPASHWLLEGLSCMLTGTLVHDVTTWFDQVVIWENVTFYELWSSYFEQLLKHFITMHHKVEHG